MNSPSRFPELVEKISILLSFAYFLFPQLGFAQNRPVKIVLQAETQQVGLGSDVIIEAILKTADNKSCSLNASTTVQLSLQWADDKISKLSLPIPAGKTSAHVTIPMTHAGVCRIKAVESHLLSGAIFILVKGTAIQGTRKVKVAMRGGVDEVVTVKSKSPPLIIEFSFDTTRAIVADGQDSAQIFATMNREAESDIRINLLTTHGLYVISIPKGQLIGVLNIASVQPTEMLFQKADVTNNIPVNGLPFHFTFVPIISRMKCVASPPNISLIENAEIVITLLDGDGRPHSTLYPRTVSLEFNKGRGEIDSTELTIPSGSFTAKAHFKPTVIGGIGITSSMDRMPLGVTFFNVSLPIFIMLLSLIGGMAGGFIAKIKNGYERWRVLIGVITGVILYWAFIYGFLPLVSHGIALNPVSAFVLSAIGGWLGINVFSVLLPKVGITGERNKKD
jgi:hypothetical protein